MHDPGHGEGPHSEIKDADEDRRCSKSLGSVVDDLGLVVETFDGGIGDPHREVAQDAFLVAPDHPCEVKMIRFRFLRADKAKKSRLMVLCDAWG